MTSESSSKYDAEYTEWQRLLTDGKTDEADTLYFEKLLPIVTEIVSVRLNSATDYSGLISLLGFTPEPVVLAARVLKPETLVVLHTPETEEYLGVVRENVDIAPAGFHHESFEHGADQTDGLYEAFTHALSRFPVGTKIMVEVTGGKKFMALQLGIAAALLEKKRGQSLDLCSVGYDEYLPQFRKPNPRTSFLEILENPIDTPLRLMNREYGGDGIIIDPIFKARNVRVDQKTAFVIMPFGMEWSDGVWKCIHGIAKSEGYECTRGDTIYGHNVVEDIWEGILAASVVIADTTGRNANVFYEIGMAHTLGKRVILLAQDADDIPFDLKVLRHLIYKDTAAGIAHLQQELPKYLAEADPQNAK